MKIYFCVLTETKNKGKGNETEGDYVYIYSGVQKHARVNRGLLVVVHKNLMKNIRCWEEANKQIIGTNK